MGKKQQKQSKNHGKTLFIIFGISFALLFCLSATVSVDVLTYQLGKNLNEKRQEKTRSDATIEEVKPSNEENQSENGKSSEEQKVPKVEERTLTHKDF